MNFLTFNSLLLFAIFILFALAPGIALPQPQGFTSLTEQQPESNVPEPEGFAPLGETDSLSPPAAQLSVAPQEMLLSDYEATYGQSPTFQQRGLIGPLSEDPVNKKEMTLSEFRQKYGRDPVYRTQPIGFLNQSARIAGSLAFAAPQASLAFATDALFQLPQVPVRLMDGLDRIIHGNLDPEDTARSRYDGSTLMVARMFEEWKNNIFGEKIDEVMARSPKESHLELFKKGNYAGITTKLGGQLGELSVHMAPQVAAFMLSGGASSSTRN